LVDLITMTDTLNTCFTDWLYCDRSCVEVFYGAQKHDILRKIFSLFRCDDTVAWFTTFTGTKLTCRSTTCCIEFGTSRTVTRKNGSVQFSWLLDSCSQSIKAPWHCLFWPSLYAAEGAKLLHICRRHLGCCCCWYRHVRLCSLLYVCPQSPEF